MSDVSDLRNKASEKLQLANNECDLVYRGQYLRDSRPLSAYRITDGCTVHVMKSVQHPVPAADALDESCVLQITRAMKQIAKTPGSGSVLDRVVKNPETLRSLVKETPSLASDPVAMAILEDRDLLLLSTVVDKDSLQKILAEHPSLGHAVLHLVSTVNGEMVRSVGETSTRAGGTQANPRVLYGLDQMSDEENEEEEGESSQPGFMSAPFMSTAPISGGQITTDFFRQAMQMVYSMNTPGGSAIQPALGAQAPGAGAQGTASAAVSPPQPQVTEGQLQQLRDMGIVDEALARRALEVTGGNIQLALDFIFGDEMS